MAVFFKMKRLYFEDKIDDDKYCGVLYGLGISWAPTQTPASMTSKGGSVHHNEWNTS